MHIPKGTLQSYVKLSTKKGRKLAGKYILEGTKLIASALDSNSQVESILYVKEESGQEKVRHILEEATNRGIQIYWLFENQLSKLTDQKGPEGVVAVIKKDENVLEDILAEKVIVALDEVADPGNVGTILRSCVWFGYRGILIGNGCVDPWSPKVMRGGMGSHFNIDIVNSNLVEDIKYLKNEKGYKLIATHLSDSAIPIRTLLSELSLEDKIIILFGNESRGIHKDLLEIADYTTIIAGNNVQDSLNVSVSAGIVLYEINNTYEKR